MATSCKIVVTEKYESLNVSLEISSIINNWLKRSACLRMDPVPASVDFWSNTVELVIDECVVAKRDEFLAIMQRHDDSIH
jgi:hypothetical protein